jgi:hypothetical protein
MAGVADPPVELHREHPFAFPRLVMNEPEEGSTAAHSGTAAAGPPDRLTETLSHRILIAALNNPRRRQTGHCPAGPKRRCRVLSAFV